MSIIDLLIIVGQWFFIIMHAFPQSVSTALREKISYCVCFTAAPLKKLLEISAQVVFFIAGHWFIVDSIRERRLFVL